MLSGGATATEGELRWSCAVPVTELCCDFSGTVLVFWGGCARDALVLGWSFTAFYWEALLAGGKLLLGGGLEMQTASVGAALEMALHVLCLSWCVAGVLAGLRW